MRLNKLSDVGVKKSKPRPGGKDRLYGDGGGLWLRVTGDEATPSRAWIFRFERNGVARRMGLGSYPDVTLQKARDRAQEKRRLLSEGRDPLEEKREQERAAVLAAARRLSFMDCATQYVDSHKAEWSEKHASDWLVSLEMHAKPVFGAYSVQDIDRELVMKALKPIWGQKTETATRVRGRIEKILAWATVAGYRIGENPARWRGNLDHLLARPSKIQSVQHQPALPYGEIGTFMEELRDQLGTTPRALEFLILTAARTSEVTLATWDEIDLPGKIWIVPAEHMKMKKEHRVPLSDPALTILQEMTIFGTKGPIFPGGKPGEPLSQMAMLMLLRRMERKDITVHGFRSTFRDWAAERTSYPRDVAEMALAHAIGDKVEAAYRRGELLDKRRRLMAEWAKFCSDIGGMTGNVRALRSA